MNVYHSTFERDGYVIVPGVLPAAAVACLSVEVDRLIGCAAEFGGAVELERPMRRSRPGDDQGEAWSSLIIGEGSRISPVLRGLIVYRPVLELVAEVMGSREFVFHFCSVVVKRPGAGVNLWHRDHANTYMRGVVPALRVLLCLDGMNRENGGTEVVRGSHHSSAREAIETRGLNARLWPSGDVVALECAPGSAVVLDGRMIHGGGANRSMMTRRNVVMQWGGELATDGRELHTGLRPLSASVIERRRCLVAVEGCVKLPEC